ncbi:MAG: hypothetical protein HeimC3_02490 [Candidatus Heimdallarchaeota archaeon LC_3]|nr:MAG: hypothetical protein HeimC3_02490 [Candidatus Heimdallarchaeota archaeon LC_3]
MFIIKYKSFYKIFRIFFLLGFFIQISLLLFVINTETTVLQQTSKNLTYEIFDKTQRNYFLSSPHGELTWEYQPGLTNSQDLQSSYGNFLTNIIFSYNNTKYSILTITVVVEYNNSPMTINILSNFDDIFTSSYNDQIILSKATFDSLKVFSFNQSDFSILNQNMTVQANFDLLPSNLYISLTNINLSQLTTYNHVVTVNYWLEKPNYSYSISQLYYYFNNTFEGLKNEITAYEFAQQIHSVNFNDHYKNSFDKIEKEHESLINTLQSYQFLLILIIVFSGLLLSHIIIFNNTKTFILLFIKGLSYQQFKSLILLSEMSGLICGIPVLLILTPVILVNPLSLDSVIENTLIISIGVLICFILGHVLLFLILDRQFLPPDAEPLDQNEDNFLNKDEITLKPQISEKKSGILQNSILFLIFITLIIFLINSFKSDLYLPIIIEQLLEPIYFFILITIILLLLINITDISDRFIFIFLKHVLPQKFLSIFPRLIDLKFKNLNTFIIIVLFSISLLQVSIFSNNADKVQLIEALKENGDIIFNPPQNYTNNQVYEKLIKNDQIESFYSIFYIPIGFSSLNITQIEDQASLLVINNKTNFYSMRSYVDGVLQSKDQWNKFILENDGILIHSSIAKRHQLELGSKLFVKLILNELEMFINFNIVGIYNGGIEPIVTPFVTTMEYINKIISNFESIIHNINSWEENLIFPTDNSNYIRSFYLKTRPTISFLSIQIALIHSFDMYEKLSGNINIIRGLIIDKNESNTHKTLPLESNELSNFFILGYFLTIIATLFYFSFLIHVSTTKKKQLFNLLCIRGYTEGSIKNLWLLTNLLRFTLVLISSVILWFCMLNLYYYKVENLDFPTLALGTVPNMPLISFNLMLLTFTSVLMFLSIMIGVFLIIRRKMKIEPLNNF